MNRIIASLLFLALGLGLNAQYFEVGLMGGGSLYSGEIGREMPLVGGPGRLHAAFGGFAKYNFSDYVALKLGVTNGTISADDANANASSREDRNLSFRSNILEFGLTAEINILGFQPYNLERPFSPYVFAGISMFNFNPTAELNGVRYDLQPLGTEGQGLPEYPDRPFYNLTEFAIPFGIGAKYAINDMWTLGFEGGARRTFTDYLDDVSTTFVDPARLAEVRGDVAAALSNRNPAAYTTGQTRGNNETFDWYYFAGFTISYNFIDNGLVGSRGRWGRGNTGCYNNF